MEIGNCGNCGRSRGDTMLIHLVRYADTGPSELLELIPQYQHQINETNTGGETPLYVACNCKNPDISTIFLLLKMGADPNIPLKNVPSGPNDRTPLMTLMNNLDNVEIAKMLLNHGAQVNITDSYGHTALHYAACSGRQKNIEFLLSKGANKTIKNRKGETAAKFAWDTNHYEIDNLIENYYPVPNLSNYHLLTPATQKNMLNLAWINQRCNLFPKDIERMIYPYLFEWGKKKKYGEHIEQIIQKAFLKLLPKPKKKMKTINY